MEKRPTQEEEASLWKRYFKLTSDELRMLIIILALSIIGLTARYLHLSSQEPDLIRPPATTTEW
jgi:hypothetical protein